MLYRYSEVLRTLIGIADLILIAAAWLAAYWLRFNTSIPIYHEVPEFRAYLQVLPVLLPLWFVLFRSYGLYEPKRTGSLLVEAGHVLRVSAVGIVILVSLGFFARSYYYSRGVVAIFSVLAPTSIITLRVGVRSCLRHLRRRGYNLRFVLVVGGGQLAEEVIDRIHAQPETGLRIRGVVAGERTGVGVKAIRGVPVLCGYGGIKELLGNEGERVDQVILALPLEESSMLEKILAELDDEVVNINVVPDLLQVLTLQSSVEELDGLPVVNLRDTPLVGWAAIAKRSMDIAVSGLALAITAPLMAGIAALIALTSGRPVFFSQERMGLDGRVFRMVKFRSMIEGAEDESGPVFTSPGDPRRTRVGAALRRFNLDELPQLWNVFRGAMSLVGPRPERPVFIEEFRREIPGYMLRHKVKSGLTGWAQVHGWRGMTSIHERVEHDLYYIRNWSVGLDIQILTMTIWRALFKRDPNAY